MIATNVNSGYHWTRGVMRTNAAYKIRKANRLLVIADFMAECLADAKGDLENEGFRVEVANVLMNHYGTDETIHSGQSIWYKGVACGWDEMERVGEKFAAAYLTQQGYHVPADPGDVEDALGRPASDLFDELCGFVVDEINDVEVQG